MKENIKILFVILFFKPYTTMPRSIEIAFGIMCWLSLFDAIMSTINLIQTINKL